MATAPIQLETAYDRIEVADVVVTLATKPGRRAAKRSLIADPVTWPAPRTTVSLFRTDTLGQWQATCTYLGQSVVVIVAQKQLDALVDFADRHLGGMTNSVAAAEADREARLAARKAEF